LPPGGFGALDTPRVRCCRGGDLGETSPVILDGAHARSSQLPTRDTPSFTGRGDKPAATTACAACPIRSLKAFREFTPEELAFVERFKLGELTVKAGSHIFLEGHDSPHLFTVLNGWILRYKLLENGHRQVLNFALRGDFLGLQNVLFDKMLHSVQALSDVRLCVFSRERVWELFSGHAGLAFDMTWMASREESMIADHLVAVGQQPAVERIAYIFLHIFQRARRAGMLHGRKLHVPITQEHIADIMGLSVVHTNKSIRALRERKLIDWRRSTLTILDEQKLIDLTGFNPDDQRARPFL